MNDQTNLNPAVLGSILLLQSSLPAAPDEKRLMEMVAHGLLAIPGVGSCAVCVEGVTVIAQDSQKAPHHDTCPVATTCATSSFTGCDGDCPLASDDSWERFDLRTERSNFGAFFLSIENEVSFAPYLPYVGNTANLLALHVENNRTSQKLNALNRGLDDQVQIQTEQLRENEAKFRAVLENSRDVLYEFNLSTGTYDYISPAIERLVGISADDYIAGGIALAVSLIHPDDRVKLQDHIDHLLNNKVEDEMTPTIEYRFKHPELGYRWFSDSRTIIYDDDQKAATVVGNCRDITAKKELEFQLAEQLEALRESEERWRTITQNSPDYIMMIDREGRIQSLNRVDANEEIDLAVGRRVSDFLPPSSAQVAAECYARVLATGKTDHYESEYIEPDGQVKAFATSVGPVMRNGKVVSLIASSRDVTKQKRAENEIRKAQEQLLDRQKRETEFAEAKLAELSQQFVHHTRLATIGQMTSSVAHEIRNPLGAVRNAAYLLKRHISSDDQTLQKYLEIIDHEVATADLVIHDMLEMARAKDPIMEPLDLAEIVREVFQRANRKNSIQCQLSSTQDPYTVVADPGQLRQVISNLVNNAIQAIQGDGEIDVELTRENGHHLIAIRDNGPGIDAKHHHQLFDPLFTTKAKGTGLGLTICRQIIERHGGTIELQDHDGSGALFCVKLPA